MRVHYNVTPTSQACTFWFYVPKKWATGNIVFGIWNTSNVKTDFWIDENNVDGWQPLFSAAHITHTSGRTTTASRPTPLSGLEFGQPTRSGRSVLTGRQAALPGPRWAGESAWGATMRSKARFREAAGEAALSHH